MICERFPKAESGFTWNEEEEFLVVGPGQSVEVELWWTPTQEGGAREVVLWKTDIGVRSQTVLIGSCIDPRPKKVGGRVEGYLMYITSLIFTHRYQGKEEKQCCICRAQVKSQYFRAVLLDDL